VINATNIIALSLIIFMASVVRGFTGFGLALVAVPLIQFFLPVTDTAVFIGFINFIFSIAYYRKSKEIVKGQPLGIMALTTGAGVAVGTAILKYVPSSSIQLVWGVLIILTVILMVRGVNFGIMSDKTALAFSGLSGGLLAGCTGITGPPVAVILSSVKTPKEKFNAIISMFIFFAVTYALVFYMVAGLIRKETLMLAACSVPALLLGLRTGDKLMDRISQKTFTKAIYIVLVIMGAITLLKGLQGMIS
jgi:hypothetical protein